MTPPPPDFEITAALRARKLVSHIPPDAQTDATRAGVTLERRETRSGLPTKMARGARYDDVVVEKRIVAQMTPEAAGVGGVPGGSPVST